MNQTEEEHKSFLEKITDFIIKIKPYAVLLWEQRKQIVLFNGGVGVITILILYFLSKTILSKHSHYSTRFWK